MFVGHHHGPISPEMNATLRDCDEYLGRLLQMIDADDYLRTHLNVIVTSDHGMHEVEKTHWLMLKDVVDSSLFSAYGGRSFVNMFVHDGTFPLHDQSLERIVACSVEYRSFVCHSLSNTQLRGVQEIANTE